MSAIPRALPFAFPIKVVPEDIDFMGHVNNARYLNWVQEAVLAHWRGIAPPEDVASKAWVAPMRCWNSSRARVRSITR